MNPSYYTAPTAKKPGLQLSPKTVGLIVGAIVVVIIAITLIVISGRNPSGEAMAEVVARNNQLLSLVDEADSELENSDLKKVNADAITMLRSDDNVLREQLTALGVAGISKEAQAALSDDFSKRLDDGRASGRFDIVYATVLKQQLEAHAALITSTKSKVGARADAALDVHNKNVQSLLQQLTPLTT